MNIASDIFEAMFYKEYEKIKDWLNNITDTNQRNKCNDLILFEMIGNGGHGIDILEYFIDNSADVNIATKLLKHAVWQRKENIIKMLIKKGANVNSVLDNKFNDSILYVATVRNRFPIVKLLVENGADVNYENMNGVTLLEEAIKNNNNSIAIYFINNGANINKTDKEGYTYLHMALEEDNFVIAKLLINKGIDVTKKTNRNINVLHFLFNREIKNRDLDKIVKLTKIFLDKGVNIYEEYNDNIKGFGNTPLDLLKEQNNVETVEKLLQKIF